MERRRREKKKERRHGAAHQRSYNHRQDKWHEKRFPPTRRGPKVKRGEFVYHNKNVRRPPQWARTPPSSTCCTGTGRCGLFKWRARENWGKEEETERWMTKEFSDVESTVICYSAFHTMRPHHRHHEKEMKIQHFWIGGGIVLFCPCPCLLLCLFIFPTAHDPLLSLDVSRASMLRIGARRPAVLLSLPKYLSRLCVNAAQDGVRVWCNRLWART